MGLLKGAEEKQGKRTSSCRYLDSYHLQFYVIRNRGYLLGISVQNN